MFTDRPIFVERPREAIQTRIGDVEMAIDLGSSFGDIHDPLRARKTTEELLQKVTHGQPIQAEYSNLLGHKAVANYEVPATVAIGHAIEMLPGNIPLPGQAINRKAVIKEGVLVKPPIERNSSLQVTPVRLNGKRLVTERANDGDTHKLAIFWMPEDQVQGFIKAEIEYDKQQRDSR